MLQSILIVLAIAVVLIFYMDIRRKARGQSKAVQKERDAITAQTHSTATMSNFKDGSATEVLLAASEDAGLFFYRRIDHGKLVLHYTVRLPNLTNIVLQINGATRDFSSESGHLTAQMRATDMARQARQGIPPEEWEKIKNIRLNILFRSEGGGEKHIVVHMYRPTQRGGVEALQKIFENAVWWQQYLSLLSLRRSEIDSLTFRESKD